MQPIQRDAAVGVGYYNTIGHEQSKHGRARSWSALVLALPFFFGCAGK
jgi:hypothetical protein